MSSWPILPVQSSTRWTAAGSRVDDGSSSVSRNAPLVSSETAERTAGMRRYRLGVKQTMGLLFDERDWRRSTWKYCAAVVG